MSPGFKTCSSEVRRRDGRASVVTCPSGDFARTCEPRCAARIFCQRAGSFAQLAEVESEFKRALVTLRWILCHGAGDDGIQSGRELGIEGRGTKRVTIGYLEANRGRPVALKRRIAGNH